MVFFDRSHTVSHQSSVVTTVYIETAKDIIKLFIGLVAQLLN